VNSSRAALALRDKSYLRVNGARLYYEDSGGNGPPVVFSHGLLWNTHLYDPQVAALVGDHRCIAYDHRGQGRSGDTAMPSIDLDTLTGDAVALIDALGAGPCHFVGLSMGGYVGMRLAARHPELVRSLSLLATDAFVEDVAKVARYRVLNAVAKVGALNLTAPAVMPILFGKTFLQDPARAEERRIWRSRLLGNRRSVHRAVRGVLERQAVDHEIVRIVAPTQVIRGSEDAAIKRRRAKATAAAIPGARFVEVPRGGHTLTIEAPGAVNRLLRQFIDAN
jgi:3-oxoadipate enol-lactonase